MYWSLFVLKEIAACMFRHSFVAKAKLNTTTWIALEKSHNENKHMDVGVCLLDFLLMNNLIKHFLTHQNENIVV